MAIRVVEFSSGRIVASDSVREVVACMINESEKLISANNIHIISYELDKKILIWLLEYKVFIKLIYGVWIVCIMIDFILEALLPKYNENLMLDLHQKFVEYKISIISIFRFKTVPFSS